MSKQFTLSIAARNALVYFVLFLIAISTLGGLIISYSSEEISRQTENRLSHTADMVQLKFDAYFKSIEADVGQLSEGPLLENFMNNPTDDNLNLLAKAYSTVLHNKLNYFQIRLISIDQEGDELIRVERKGNEVLVTPKDLLQNKRNRDYFEELRQIPIDSLYFSKIDLNKEFGELSQPYIPTARVGKRLRGGALDQFIILVNIDLTFLFTDMLQSLPSAFELRMLNEQNHYLIHPKKDAEFTFEFDKPPYFNAEFNQAIDTLVNNRAFLEKQDDLFSFFRFNYYRDQYGLYGAVSAKKAVVFASFYAWRNTVIYISIGVALLFLALAFVYMRRQVGELKSITKQLTGFAGEVIPRKLAIERKDEIGQLARGFEQMSREISDSHEALTKAQQKAENAAKGKTEFIENLSHEIRNPLQSILGAVQIIEQNQSSPEQKPFIDALKFSTTQLKYLVSDVLDFNKMKEKELKLIPKWVDLDHFCREIIRTAKYEADQKQIKLAIEIADQFTERRYYFDPARLYQIINNLLSNAIKFTPNGGSVVLNVKELANNKIHFSVIDSGPGLSAIDREKILDRNYSTNYNTGAGLGLAIVKDLLRLFKSQLDIAENEFKGSTFGFSLALEAQDFYKGDEEYDASKDLNKLNILIVEDDKQLIDWYKYILSESTLAIITSFDKITALTNHHFDVIISDLNIHGGQLDLNEIVPVYQQKLRITGQIIIVSGESPSSENTSYLQLQKPVDKTELLQAILKKKTTFKQEPVFTNFEKDYDYQSELIKNALSILLEQFKKDQIVLQEAIINRDLKLFGAVQHRIITSLRRLNLGEFEAYLTELSQYLSENKKDFKAEQKKLSAMFESAIAAIAKYISRN
jgi:signal transduction histidine kinase